MKLTNLTPASSPKEKMVALKEFLQSWYDLDFEGERSRAGLPIAMAELYDFAGRSLPQAFPHNRILPSALLKPEGDKTLFYAESEGGLKWAYGTGEDPAVFQVGSRGGDQWQQVSPSLSTFLVYAALKEANLIAPCRAKCKDFSEAARTAMSKSLKPVNLGPIDWLNGATYYVKDQVVAWAGPAGGGVDIAGQDEDSMAFVEELSDDSWEITI